MDACGNDRNIEEARHTIPCMQDNVIAEVLPPRLRFSSPKSYGFNAAAAAWTSSSRTYRRSRVLGLLSQSPDFPRSKILRQPRSLYRKVSFLGRMASRKLPVWSSGDPHELIETLQMPLMHFIRRLGSDDKVSTLRSASNLKARAAIAGGTLPS